MHSHSFLRLCLLGIALNGAASLMADPAPFVMKLWPENPPGSIQDQSYKEKVASARIGQVTDPTLEVFLPAPEIAKGSAVVICPGGGYARLAYDHEGIQVAKWFQSQGIVGVVLKYRLPSDKIMKDKTVGPLQDVQEAIRVVRRKAAEWKLSTNKIGVMGFSAGGHLAASATTLYAYPAYTPSDATSARPDFSILVYGVISMQRELTHKGSHDNLLGSDASKELEDRFSNELNVTPETPTSFLIHSADDKTVPVENTLRFHAAMLKNKVPGELHIYEKGGHGFGLGVNANSPKQWPSALSAWLVAIGVL